MTRNNRQCINTICTKFIKICQAYSCINTSMHTSRPSKNADKPDGLAYNKSQHGREALPVCWQLGTDHTGPMGHASHNRVPVRAYPNPTSSQVTQVISYSKEEHAKISQEIKELLDKGAIVEAPLSTGSYISQIFLVEKKGGGQRPVINLKGLNSL